MSCKSGPSFASLAVTFRCSALIPEGIESSCQRMRFWVSVMGPVQPETSGRACKADTQGCCAAMQESVLYAASSVLRISLMKIVKAMQTVIRVIVQVCCDIYKHRWVSSQRLCMPPSQQLQRTVEPKKHAEANVTCAAQFQEYTSCCIIDTLTVTM